MIQQLIESIGALLHYHLFNNDPNAKAQVLIGIPAANPPAKLPSVAIYSTPTSFGMKQQDDQAWREFSQSCTIAIYTKEPAQAERWLSLSIGAVLLSQTELLQQYNQQNPVRYRSSAVESLHQIYSIQLLGAEPQAASDFYQWQIQLLVHGQFQAKLRQPVEADYIREVLLQLAQTSPNLPE